MASKSLTQQVNALLERRLVASRTSPDGVGTEAASLFESCLVALITKPRSILFLALQAANGLQAVVQKELTAIATLRQDVLDLSNATPQITEGSSLQVARTSLLQLEGLDRISTDSGAYRQFDRAVETFLKKEIGRNLRSDEGVLRRSGDEARAAMMENLKALGTLHEELLDRLYSLVVGVDNFLSSPLGTVVGAGTVSRARQELESILDEVEAKTASLGDVISRVIASRAAIQVLGSPPQIDDPVLDTSRSIPAGSILRGVSDPSPALVSSSPGPYTFPPLAQVTMTVGSESWGPFQFPQTSFDLNNQAHLVGEQLPMEVVLPPDLSLFVGLGPEDTLTTYRIGPIPSGSYTVSTLVSALSSAITAAGLSSVFGVDEYIQPGTRRLLFYTKNGLPFRVTDLLLVQDEEGGPYTATSKLPELLKVAPHKEAMSGAVTLEFVVDAMAQLFPCVNVEKQAETFSLKSIETGPGVTLNVDAPACLGIAGTHRGSSVSLRFAGQIAGVPSDPANLVKLLSVGDVLESSTGTAALSKVGAERVTLNAPLPTFEGPVRVSSVLAFIHRALMSELEKFLASWMRGAYASDLRQVDAAIATLGGQGAASRRSAVLQLLNELEMSLQSLQTTLQNESLKLNPGAAKEEREVANSILASFKERKFDRAADFLLRCKLADLLEMTSETASYGGAFLKASFDFAQADLRFPNAAAESDTETKTHRRES